MKGRIERCQDLIRKSLTVEYVNTIRLGDHVTYISDLRRRQAVWRITRSREEILRELTGTRGA
jgi:hypothetical protein